MTPTENALSLLVTLVERLQDNVRDPAMLQSIINQGSTGHAYEASRAVLAKVGPLELADAHLQIASRALVELRDLRKQLPALTPAWRANVTACDNLAVLESRLAELGSGDQVPATESLADEGLSAEQLSDKYGTDTSWGEHPSHSRSAWQEEVSNGDVQSGYWDWVVSQIEQEDNTDLQVEESESDRGDSPR